MKRLKSPRTLALMLVCLPLVVRAAEPKAVSDSSAAGSPPGNAQFDLNFPGGSPSDLVSALEKASKRKLNVLKAPEFETTLIPPIQLRSVTEGDVFEALNRLYRDLRWSAGQGGVWVPQVVPEQRQTKVFYIGHLLKAFEIDDITTAIQTTWAMGKDEAAAGNPNQAAAKGAGSWRTGAGQAIATRGPELKYHQDTRLLIVLAEQRQLRTVEEVLSQLKLALAPDAAEASSTPSDREAVSREGRAATTLPALKP